MHPGRDHAIWGPTGALSIAQPVAPGCLTSGEYSVVGSGASPKRCVQHGLLVPVLALPQRGGRGRILFAWAGRMANGVCLEFAIRRGFRPECGLPNRALRQREASEGRTHIRHPALDATGVDFRQVLFHKLDHVIQDEPRDLDRLGKRRTIG